MRLTHKVCSNCGAIMSWNILKGRWECRLCGAAELDKWSDPFNRFPRFN